MEVVGPDLYDQGFVTEGFLRQRIASTVTLPERPRVADLLDDEVTTYGRTQAWARALRHHGFDGIVFGLRFRPNAEGLAVFGTSGPAVVAPVHGPSREALEVAEDLDLPILYAHQLGRLVDFTVVDP